MFSAIQPIAYILIRKDIIMNKTPNNIDKATQTTTNINKMTQTNIEKANKTNTAATSAPAASGTKPTGKPATANKNTKKKRRRVHFKPNFGGMMSLLALILIIAVAATLIVFLTKGAIKWIDSKNTTESQTDDPNKGNQPLPWNNAYVPEQHANTNKNVGDLILVNAQNAYALTDTISSKLTNLYGYEGHGSYYVLPDSNTKIRSTIIQAMKQLIFDMVDANPNTLGTSSEFDRLYITAAYRDTATQESLNSTNPNRYPELPGYSEHHTGLAFDLKVMSKEATISLRDNEYEWLEANCAKYGFIIRYDASKSALTGIADEPYHLRYVGIPHATYMTEHDLCLEEYLELLRNSHKYDQTPLEFKAGEQEYLVYYVAANTAEGATFTSIPVPPATEGTYTISGDNMNGFIVTVTKTAK